jgi:hypothetical protein
MAFKAEICIFNIHIIFLFPQACLHPQRMGD